jgi:hypothetical protein
VVHPRHLREAPRAAPNLGRPVLDRRSDAMTSTAFQPTIRRGLPVIAALGLALVVAGPVGAAAPGQGRITRGAVTAAFQARTTGGYVNGLAGRTMAAPVRGLHDGRISSFFDTVLCSSDWHYLGVTILSEGSRQVAGNFLQTVRITYAIDGVPITGTMRSAIKPFVGTGIRGQYGVSVGKLVAPGTIADGGHVLETVISSAGAPDQIDDVTFTLTPDACG